MYVCVLQRNTEVDADVQEEASAADDGGQAPRGGRLPDEFQRRRQEQSTAGAAMSHQTSVAQQEPRIRKGSESRENLWLTCFFI